MDICGCQPQESTGTLVEELVEQIQESVGASNVFLMVSGGVDSTVAYLLLTRALGQDRVRGIWRQEVLAPMTQSIPSRSWRWSVAGRPVGSRWGGNTVAQAHRRLERHHRPGKIMLQVR